MKKILLSLVLVVLWVHGAIAQVPSGKPTYVASIFNLAAPSGATDSLCLENPNGAVIRLFGVSVYGVGGAAAVANVSLVRRSTLNGGGTSITPAVVQTDPSLAASQATFRAWTVNPTSLGTAAGTLRQLRWDITTNGSNADASGSAVLNFVPLLGSGFVPTIRAANSALCLNFNAVSTTVSLTSDWVWGEGN